jgi:hypothetical protein
VIVVWALESLSASGRELNLVALGVFFVATRVCVVSTIPSQSKAAMESYYDGAKFAMVQAGLQVLVSTPESIEANRMRAGRDWNLAQDARAAKAREIGKEAPTTTDNDWLEYEMLCDLLGMPLLASPSIPSLEVMLAPDSAVALYESTYGTQSTSSQTSQVLYLLYDCLTCCFTVTALLLCFRA